VPEDKTESPAALKASPGAAVAATPEGQKPLEAPVYRPGDVVGGKYRLEGLLGRGGAGDVWLAHNDTLDVDVAVKLIRGVGRDPDAAQRLLQEARAAARLGHPAIVRIVDFGRASGGEPFIVMERLVGEDLSAAVKRRGRLTPETAVRTLLPIAHALSAAHAKRIVHRDLKPENIFLAKSEGDKLQPTIVDFGIAQVDRGHVARTTVPGASLGNPAYMAPEQAIGAEVDHRADIWSFCVVLYEVATSQLPFQAKVRSETVDAILEQAPVPTTEHGVGDARLWEILARGLAKNPDERFQTMREVGEALAGWLLDRNIRQDITGASLELTWRTRFGGVSLENLNSLPPPANPITRAEAGAETLLEAEPSASYAEGAPPSRAILFVAIGAVVIGVLAGVAIVSSSSSDTKRRGPDANASALAGISSAGTAAAAPSVPGTSHVPTVTPSSPERITSAPSASSEGTSLRGGGQNKPQRPRARKSLPLKDPFQ
jgi:serine/threonine-protein kinase